MTIEIPNDPSLLYDLVAESQNRRDLPRSVREALDRKGLNTLDRMRREAAAMPVDPHEGQRVDMSKGQQKVAQRKAAARAFREARKAQEAAEHNRRHQQQINEAGGIVE